MAATIVVGTNSYASIADAQTYFDARLHSTSWGTDADIHARALIMATARLEAEEYIGDRVSATQALKWPRDGMDLIDGVDYNSTTPDLIKAGLYEMALYLIDNDASQQNDPATNAKSFSVGPISVELSQQEYHVSSLPPYVSNMIDPFRENSSNQPTVSR